MLFVPTLPPFTFHWNDGVVPPLTGVAVKVTDVLEQTGLADAAIVTLTGNIGFTVMVIGVDVAGLPVAQIAFDVRTTVTISPLTGV